MARKKLETLTEQMYYVLLALRKERHGYAVMQAISALTDADPADSPAIVIRSGSPPKAAMLSLTQRMAAAWSMNP